MNRVFLYFILVIATSCVSEIKKPGIQETEADYSYFEYKYAKNQDSIFSEKSYQKFYHFEITKEIDNWVASWTEKIPTTAIDSNSSEIDNLLNGKEFTNGFAAKFVLYQNGAIDSLENWIALKKYTDSLTTIYYHSAGLNNEEIEKIQPFLKTYQTKERLLNTLYKGIFAYHNFYGIDASFDDTLTISDYSLELNESSNISEATIRISRPNEKLVDYVVSSEYAGANDTIVISELEKLTNNQENEFNSLKFITLKDTIYYRFNKEEQLIENVFIKRLITCDSIQFFIEISLTKE